MGVQHFEEGFGCVSWYDEKASHSGFCFKIGSTQLRYLQHATAMMVSSPPSETSKHHHGGDECHFGRRKKLILKRFSNG